MSASVFIQAEVMYNSERAGILIKKPGVYVFTYDPTYLERADALPISLSLPLQAESFESKELFPFFDGLLPEGWLQELTARTLHLDPEDRFGFLLVTGGHTIGAVSVRPIPPLRPGGPADASVAGKETEND